MNNPTSSQIYSNFDINNGYESDFEKEIVYQSHCTKNDKKFRNIEEFMTFAENDKSIESLKFLKQNIGNYLHQFNLEKVKNNEQINISLSKCVIDTEINNKHETHLVKTKNESIKQPKFHIFKKNHHENIQVKKLKLPISRKFNPIFTKRENIDKIIIRKFRNFMKDFYWKQPKIFDLGKNKELWFKFINEDLLPPVKFTYYGESHHFKSFNTSYICWLFSQKNAEYQYNIFLNNKGYSLFDSLIEKYSRKINELNDDEKTEIKKNASIIYK